MLSQLCLSDLFEDVVIVKSSGTQRNVKICSKHFAVAKKEEWRENLKGLEPKGRCRKYCKTLCGMLLAYESPVPTRYKRIFTTNIIYLNVFRIFLIHGYPKVDIYTKSLFLNLFTKFLMHGYSFVLVGTDGHLSMLIHKLEWKRNRIWKCNRIWTRGICKWKFLVTTLALLYCCALSTALYNFFHLQFRQWRSHADKDLTLYMNIQLTLFWSTWSRARGQGPGLGYMCWPGTQAVIIAIVNLRAISSQNLWPLLNHSTIMIVFPHCQLSNILKKHGPA